MKVLECTDVTKKDNCCLSAGLSVIILFVFVFVCVCVFFFWPPTGQVARCTKIINAGQEDAKYVINVRQIAKFVVGLGEKVSGITTAAASIVTVVASAAICNAAVFAAVPTTLLLVLHRKKPALL